MKANTISIPKEIRNSDISIVPVNVEHAQFVLEARIESQKELSLWMPWGREPIDFEKLKSNFKRSEDRFGDRTDLKFHIFSATSNRFLGCISLHRCNWEFRTFMIGYWLRQSEVGKGIMSQAVNLMTRFAFDELACTRLEIYCNRENFRSIAIPKRLNFPLEGVLLNNDVYADRSIKCRDELLFARTNAKEMAEITKPVYYW